MSLPKFTKDVQIISKLDDEPNDVGGLSADEFKAKFDEASVLIKEFINNTLLPYLEGVNAAGNIGISNIPGLNDVATVQAALQELKTQLNNTSIGSIPDRSISGVKLKSGAIGTEELADSSVSSTKIENGSINDSKISSSKLSGAVIKNSTIENKHFNGKVIKAENVQDNTLTGDQMKDLSIPAGKLASSSVQTSKIADGAVTYSKLAENSVGTARIIDGAVTRTKLADDALYSPVSFITNSSYSITNADSGKTLTDAYSARANPFTFSLTQGNSTNIPLGYEVAIIWRYCTSVTISFSGIRACVPGNGQISTSSSAGSVKISEKFGTIAMKKIEGDSTYGDMWIITGNVEVVS